MFFFCIIIPVQGRQQFLYQVFGEDSGITDLSSLHIDDSFLLTNTPELPDLVESVFEFDQGMFGMDLVFRIR